MCTPGVTSTSLLTSEFTLTGIDSILRLAHDHLESTREHSLLLLKSVHALDGLRNSARSRSIVWVSEV